MNSITRFARIPALLANGRRCASSLANKPIYQSVTKLSPEELANFDPKNYDLPKRAPTLDDIMEPYGSWKEAYEAERKTANKDLFIGIVCLGTALVIFYQSGVMDTLYMPNLDNLMEDTEPFDRESDR